MEVCLSRVPIRSDRLSAVTAQDTNVELGHRGRLLDAGERRPIEAWRRNRRLGWEIITGGGVRLSARSRTCQRRRRVEPPPGSVGWRSVGALEAESGAG